MLVTSDYLSSFLESDLISFLPLNMLQRALGTCRAEVLKVRCNPSFRSVSLTYHRIPSTPTSLRLISPGLPPKNTAPLRLSLRSFQHLAPENPKPVQPKQTPPPTPQKPPPPKEEDRHPTNAEQRKSDWKIIKQLLANVWPKNDWRTRVTVLGGFVLLISAKVLPSATIDTELWTLTKNLT